MHGYVTNSFVSILHDLARREHSENTILQAKRCLLDYLGVTYAGAKEFMCKGGEVFTHLKLEGNFKTIGFDAPFSLENSIFMSGISSHFLDLDDGVRFGALHPGAPILSALMPVAMSEDISSDKFIRAIVIGYECAIRIAQAIQPSHYNKGYHPTATCGTIGAAVAIGVALDFDKQKIKNAISAATLSATGSLKVIEDDSELKPFNVARASLMGYMSAFIARVGFLGSSEPLLGNTGFLSMVADDYKEEILLDENPEHIGIEKVYFKLYSACRHCHPSIEAVLKIRQEREFQSNEINAINIKTYDYVIGKHDHSHVQSIQSAKMSIPYCVAVALLHGELGTDKFNLNLINSEEIKNVMSKVNVTEEKSFTELVPQMRSAIVEIMTNDGKQYSERVDYPKGEPENPLTDQEVEDKFRSLAQYSGKSESESRQIIDCVWDIENRIGELFKLI